MTRLINPETGGVVTCGGNLADRYASRGWISADAVPQPAPKAAPEKPEAAVSDETTADDKPVTRRSTRRK